MSDKHIKFTNSSSHNITRRVFLKVTVAGLLVGCAPRQLATLTPQATTTAVPFPSTMLPPAASPETRAVNINHSDVIFSNPHYNFLDTGIYDDYNPDMVAWGFLPASQGNTDTANYLKAVTRHQEAGINFQARIEWDVVWDGMQNFTADYEQAACRDFDGDMLSFPWNRSHYWFCSHQPLFQDYILHQIEMALSADPDALMFDSQTSTPITYTHGGCFCDRCMVHFPTWLGQNFASDELISMGVSDVSTFDYHSFLVDKGYSKTIYDNSVKKWPNDIPLSNEYRLFQLHFINSYVRELANHARSGVDHPLMISTSSPIVDPYFHGARLVTVPEIDFYTQEYNHNADKKAVPEEVVTLYKIADTLERPAVITAQPYPDWLTMHRENRVNLARSWITQAYAHGAIFMVPIKMWAYEGSKHYWYQSRSGDYDFIYHFIGENANMFDDYEPVSHLGLLYVHTAYRNDSKLIFDACAALTHENIPFRLVIAGDDWWPRYLDEDELENLDVVVTTADAKHLDATQKATLDSVGERVLRWSDMTNLFDRFSREITVDRSDITVLPRANPTNPQAPAICHLLNRNYQKDDDTFSRQKNFQITLTKSLYGNTFSTATLFAPRQEPLAIDCQDLGEATQVTVPELDLWAIIRLK